MKVVIVSDLVDSEKRPITLSFEFSKKCLKESPTKETTDDFVFITKYSVDSVDFSAKIICSADDAHHLDMKAKTWIQPIELWKTAIIPFCRLLANKTESVDIRNVHYFKENRCSSEFNELTKTTDAVISFSKKFNGVHFTVITFRV